MRKSVFFKTLAAVVLGGALVACNPDKGADKVEKNLPELADLQVAPGAEGTVKFYAYDTWTIAADKEWCTFNPQSGEKGDKEVAYTIADGFVAAETANVTLTIGTDKVAFKIERTSKVRSLEVSTAAPLQTVIFSEETASYELTVKANYPWDLNTSAASWPGWLTKPQAAVSGTLNNESGLYEGTFTLAVDETAIANYYEDKEGVITFSDIDEIDFTFEFPVSHTFEKPAFVGRLAAEGFGSEITIDLDGNIVGHTGENKKSLDFTLTAAAGEQNFQAYYVDYGDNVGSGRFNPLLAGQNANGTPWRWFTLTQKAGNTYTLTINNYPAPLEINGTPKKYYTGYVFFLPDSVWGSWMQPFQSPDAVMWFVTQQSTYFVEDASYQLTNTLQESIKPYAIVINVNQPAA